MTAAPVSRGSFNGRPVSSGQPSSSDAAGTSSPAAMAAAGATQAVSTPEASIEKSSHDTMRLTPSTAPASSRSDSSGSSSGGGSGSGTVRALLSGGSSNGLPQVVPPATSRLDQPDLLHSFYRWCCREFSEPATPPRPRRAPDLSDRISGDKSDGSTTFSPVASVSGALAPSPSGSSVASFSFTGTPVVHGSSVGDNGVSGTSGGTGDVSTCGGAGRGIGNANGRRSDGSVIACAECGAQDCGSPGYRSGGGRGGGMGTLKSKQVDTPEHSHGPSESLAIEGALDLYFKRRNLAVHAAAKVSIP